MAARLRQAEPRPAPRLYLVTPPVADAQGFASDLRVALDASDIAAVLLRLTEGDERTQINRVKVLAPPVQDKGAALLIDGHADLVARGAVDGAHLTGIEAFNEAVGRLKPERIVGIGGLATRHDAMAAAEAGADYLMFGAPDARGTRQNFAAIEERVAWWAEVFEVPCVGYAAALEEVAPLAAVGADFVALGDWLWRDAANVIAQAAEQMCLPENAA